MMAVRAMLKQQMELELQSCYMYQDMYLLRSNRDGALLPLHVSLR